MISNKLSESVRFYLNSKLYVTNLNIMIFIFLIELLVENSGEGILLWMKVRAFVPALRELIPTAFQHTEWAATQTEAGRTKVAAFEKRFGDKFVAPA